MSKDKKRDINIRRFFSWSNIVKGKPIYIRLYELIYFELLKLWIEMGAPPLRAAIYELINKKDFDDNFIKGKIFQNYINEIKENQCEDNSGFFIYNSEEVLSNKNIIELHDVKKLIMDELNTSDIVDRYNSIFVFFSLYESWSLKKKEKQIKDVTKKERFDVTPDLPLKII